MSGYMVQLFLDVSREELGEAVVAQALASLPADVARTLTSATAVGWLPISASERLVDALATAAQMGVVPLRQRIVPAATKKGMGGVWRALLRLTSPEALVQRTPAIYARGRSQGRLVVTRVGEGSAELSLVGWPDVPDGQLHSVALSTQTILRMSGRAESVVTWTRAPDGGRFFVRFAAFV